MREKRKVIHAPDQAGAKQSLKEYCEAHSKLKALEGKMEQAIQKIRDKYKDEVIELQAVKSDSMAMLHAYSLQNKDELYSIRKSVDWGFGIIGFRTGTPKVEKSRGITWDKAVKMIETLDLPFVRTKKEVDKDKIIASRSDQEVMSKLRGLGISVVQQETFFIEPKEEELVNG